MANNNQKGILIKKENLSEFPPERMPINKLSLFMDALFGRTRYLTAINLIMIIFALPAIVVVALAYANTVLDSAIVPYSANIGFGLPVVPDPSAIGATREYGYASQAIFLLMPCIVVVFLGFSGAFYCMQRILCGDNTKIFKSFLYGIKKYSLVFLASSVAVALTVGLMGINIVSYNFMQISDALKIVIIISSVVLAGFTLTAAMFFSTMSVVYNLPITLRLVLSLKLALRILPFNLIIAAISVLPEILIVWLFGVEIIGVVLFTLFLLLGISFTVLVWVCYTNSVFSRNFFVQGEPAAKAKR